MEKVKWQPGDPAVLQPSALTDRRCTVLKFREPDAVTVRMDGWPDKPTLILPGDLLRGPHDPPESRGAT